MKPINFDGANVVFGVNQPEYISLPAAVNHKQGSVLTCWKLSPEEIQKVQETGTVWLEVLTFNQPLQPVRLSAERPE